MLKQQQRFPSCLLNYYNGLLTHIHCQNKNNKTVLATIGVTKHK